MLLPSLPPLLITPARCCCIPTTVGVYLTMKSLLTTGCKVVAMAPSYQSLYELAAANGCDVQFWEPHLADNGGVQYRVQDVLVGTGCVACMQASCCSACRSQQVACSREACPGCCRRLRCLLLCNPYGLPHCAWLDTC